MKTTRLLCLLAVLSLGQAWAQGSSEYKAGIKIPLDQEGKKYIRFITWNQMWMRSIQNNPGTASISDPTKRDDQVWDIGVRRARALWYAQITPRYLVLTHIGINNQTFASGGPAAANYSTGTAAFGNNKKPQLFLHDFWNEYRVFRTDKESADGKSKTEHNSLFIGAGLHYWHGVSRLANASTLNFLAVDAPVWNWYNIEFTDQFARQFGIYAKGKIATHLDYRAYLNKPFMLDQRTATAGPKTTSWASTTSVNDSRAGYVPTDKFSYGGYFNWQFWDQESNVLPFTVGTYVGTKKVFNIGFGFNHHPDALMTYQRKDTTVFVAVDSARYDQTNWGVDAFLDMPLGKEGKSGAITAYLLYQNNNYGPNFYRSVGIMPITNGTNGFATAADQAPTAAEKSIDGSGNARPFLGTGNVVFAELGYLLPKNFAGEKFGSLCRVQPFATYTLKNLDYLGVGGSNYIDAGCNFFMDGHHSKLTIEYSTRPLVTGSAAINGTRAISGSRGEFIIQAQVYL